MADKANDILMRMMVTESTPLYAECQTEVTTDEDDFVFDYYNGQFFELTDFTFGMNLDDKSPSDTGSGGGGGITPANLLAAKARLRPLGGPSAGSIAPPPPPAQAASQGRFQSWKSATAAEITSMPPYEVKMDEFSVTRLYDMASPVLFEKCCNSDTFVSASIVKRKLIGAEMLRGFLRIDFDDVMITHVDWQNGENVKETLKFAFRKMTVQYRKIVYQQDNVPTLQLLPSLTWSYTMALAAAAAATS